MGLSRELILRGKNDSVVKAYLEYMIDMAVIFGADRNRAEKEMLDVLTFEMNLANVCGFLGRIFQANEVGTHQTYFFPNKLRLLKNILKLI